MSDISCNCSALEAANLEERPGGKSEAGVLRARQSRDAKKDGEGWRAGGGGGVVRARGCWAKGKGEGSAWSFVGGGGGGGRGREGFGGINGAAAAATKEGEDGRAWRPAVRPTAAAKAGQIARGGGGTRQIKAAGQGRWAGVSAGSRLGLGASACVCVFFLRRAAPPYSLRGAAQWGGGGEGGGVGERGGG